jgi:hypothetical protein
MVNLTHFNHHPELAVHKCLRKKTKLHRLLRGRRADYLVATNLTSMKHQETLLQKATLNLSRKKNSAAAGESAAREITLGESKPAQIVSTMTPATLPVDFRENRWSPLHEW